MPPQAKVWSCDRLLQDSERHVSYRLEQVLGRIIGKTHQDLSDAVSEHDIVRIGDVSETAHQLQDFVATHGEVLAPGFSRGQLLIADTMIERCSHFGC